MAGNRVLIYQIINNHTSNSNNQMQGHTCINNNQVQGSSSSNVSQLSQGNK